MKSSTTSNMTTGGPCCVYDFTCPLMDKEEIIVWLKDNCKKWTFQLEKGESGYEHFQGRMSLKIKKRLGELIKLSWTKEVHWSVTSNENRDNDFYVMKSDTRIEGPWSDKDIEKFMPYQYGHIGKQLLKWQQYIYDHKDDREPRYVNIIVDPVGNKGKSSFASWMEIEGHGCDMPPCNDGKELIQAALCMWNNVTRDPKIVFIDLPRAMPQDQLRGLYTAIEQIKKGKLYDFRYSYKSWWIHAPQIWVFCNTAPTREYLSPDRWKIWKFSSDGNLVKSEL